MRIGISLLNFRPGKIGGTETSLRKTLQHLPAAAAADELHCIVFRDNASSIAIDGLKQLIVDASDQQIVRARIIEAFTPFSARRVSRQIAAQQFDVLWFPQQSIFPKRVTGPCCLTVN